MYTAYYAASIYFKVVILSKTIGIFVLYLKLLSSNKALSNDTKYSISLKKSMDSSTTVNQDKL